MIDAQCKLSSAMTEARCNAVRKSERMCSNCPGIGGAVVPIYLTAKQRKRLEQQAEELGHDPDNVMDELTELFLSGQLRVTI